MAEPPYLYDEELEDSVQDFLWQQEYDFESDSGSGSGSDSDSDSDSESESEEEDDGQHIVVPDTPQLRVPIGNNDSSSGDAERGRVEGEREKRRRGNRSLGGEEANGEESREGGGGEGSQGREWNRSEIDGLFCPICMEAWTSDGGHHLCCLPCGHLFGLSCITKWLRQKSTAAKCPQCNRKCTLKDIRKIYAPSIAVIDEETQKKIRFLEDKCASLEKRGSDWCKKEYEWRMREAELNQKVSELTNRTTHLERLLGDRQHGSAAHENISNPMHKQQGSSSNILLQTELRVNGARLFDIDASGQIILFTRRLPGMGGSMVITKVSLTYPHEMEDICLPASTKFIKDLRVSPYDGSISLFASFSKKLSVISTESKNTILSYDLPVPPWSCSWDLNSSHHIYAGLQNGSLMMFDMRQTMRPVESIKGLTTHPIHTIISLQQDRTHPPGSRELLSASSSGVCQWKFGVTEESLNLVPEMADQDACISLSYCPTSGDIIASYRPRLDTSNEISLTQSSPTPPPSIGQGVMGSHLHLKRAGSNYQKLHTLHATVSDIRLPKSVIVDTINQSPVFAFPVDAICGLSLHSLPSFNSVDFLKSPKGIVLDVKYARTQNGSLLGCLSEDIFQIFNINNS